MSDPRNIVVTGCKGCPFAHEWDDEYGNYGVTCSLSPDEVDVDHFASVDNRRPEWCQLPVIVHAAEVRS